MSGAGPKSTSRAFSAHARAAAARAAEDAEALEAALDAALDVLPAEPLLFLAEHIRKHYGS